MMFSFANLATPETTNFMIAGYIVMFSIMLIYVASLYLRRRKLTLDLKTLEEMANEEDNL